MLCFGMLLAPGAARGEDPARALLRAYAEHQAKIQRHIAKFESQEENDCQFKAPHANLNGHNTLYFAGEVRYDGRRFCSRVSRWGNVFGPASHQPKEQPQYQSCLNDGRMTLYYNFAATSRARPKGCGTLQRHDQASSATTAQARPLANTDTAPLLGYLYSDSLRVDEILLQAPALSLSPGQGALAHCQVIAGKSKFGEYKVWLDPARGHQLVRAELHRRPGDVNTFSQTKPLSKGCRQDYVLEGVELKQLQGRWAPMAARWTNHLAYGDGQSSRQTRTIRRTALTLDPDFEALHAFVPDDIREGATIIQLGQPGEYIWLKGSVAPKSELKAKPAQPQ